MSDEDRDKRDRPGEGESEHATRQRQTSPELQWPDLFGGLAARVVTNEKRFEAYEEESRRRNERVESKIEFIVSQQAQFAAAMQQSREEQEERWRKADTRWAETERGIRALLAIAEIHEREIEALRESQERTDKQLAETGGRVDALVNTAERLISERRNGRSGGPEESAGEG